MTTSRILALVLGVLGVAGLLTGALLPWLTTPSGVEISGQHPVAALPLGAMASAVVAVAAHWSPRWLPLPILAMLVLVVVATLIVEPGWLCWDGVDANGDPVGGCEEDVYTLAPAVFGLGAALAMLGAAIRWLSRGESRPAPQP